MHSRRIWLGTNCRPGRRHQPAAVTQIRSVPEVPRELRALVQAQSRLNSAAIISLFAHALPISPRLHQRAQGSHKDERTDKTAVS
jgi:hypothetical protein